MLSESGELDLGIHRPLLCRAASILTRISQNYGRRRIVQSSIEQNSLLPVDEEIESFTPRRMIVRISRLGFLAASPKPRSEIEPIGSDSTTVLPNRGEFATASTLTFVDHPVLRGNAARGIDIKQTAVRYMTKIVVVWGVAPKNCRCPRRAFSRANTCSSLLTCLCSREMLDLKRNCVSHQNQIRTRMIRKSFRVGRVL